jgi:hypothetical protein
MKKIFSPSNPVQTITMLLFWSMSGICYSPPVSAQDYRNCAGLQKRFIANNPEIRFQGFEKAEMQVERSMPFQSVYATAFFCNGGTIVERYPDTIKWACNGYIVYYISPYSNDQGLNKQYSAGRGKYQNRMVKQKMESTCRQVT